MTIKCTKCGEDKSPDNFQNLPKKKNGKASWCRACCHSRIRSVARAVKERWIEYKGGACIVCRVKGLHPACYDFHHRNPKAEDIHMSRIATANWGRAKSELDKTDLICANCHRILSAKY